MQLVPVLWSGRTEHHRNPFTDRTAGRAGSNCEPHGEGFVFFGDVFTHDGTELIIYNHAGQQIAVLNGNGSSNIVWDGIAAAGNVAVNGMYVAVIRSEEEN